MRFRRLRAATRSGSGRRRSRRRPARSRRRRRTAAGCPWSGRSARTTQRLIAAWTTIIAVAPAARKPAKASGARRAARRPRQATTPKQSHQPGGSHEAELLAHDREDEVGVRIRQEEELLPAAAEAVAEPAAGAHRDEGLDGLEPGAERVGLRLEEREEPRAAVVRREQDGRERRNERQQPDRGTAAPARRRAREGRRRASRSRRRCRSPAASTTTPAAARVKTRAGSRARSPLAAVSPLRESW